VDSQPSPRMTGTSQRLAQFGLADVPTLFGFMADGHIEESVFL